jgi:hypothetical protein
MRPHALPNPLYFARRAPKWGGAGVAFVGHRPYPGRRTMARLFLLEHQQFEDVVAQENGQRAGSVVVSIETAISNGYQDVRETGWYRRVLHVGVLDGYPILTCTAAWDIDEEEPVAPALGYLRWICMGLRESLGLSSAEIASYLLVSPGMTAYGSQAELQSTIDGLLGNLIGGTGTGQGE